jgi:hypothetical protein
VSSRGAFVRRQRRSAAARAAPHALEARAQRSADALVKEQSTQQQQQQSDAPTVVSLFADVRISARRARCTRSISSSRGVRMVPAGTAGAGERQARNARQVSLRGDLLTAQQTSAGGCTRKQRGAQRGNGASSRAPAARASYWARTARRTRA